MLALILIGSSSLCQAQQATVVKQLDEHSFVVEIGGKRYKAVDNELLNEQARSFDKLTAQRDAALADVSAANSQSSVLRDEKVKLEGKVNDLIAQRDDARRDVQDARVFIAQQKQLLDQEAEARKATQQFIPHGNSGGWAGKLLDFFDKPAVQAGMKIVLPLAQTAKTFAQCR